MNDKRLKANTSSSTNRLCCSQCQYVSEFMQKIPLNDLADSAQNVINDMDRVADIIFRR